MKKIIFPLAMASALSFAQTAYSQSNVTAYGMVDLGVGRAVNSDNYGVLQGLASRVGFKGQEDLGGGWKASFHLQHRFNADTGASSNPAKYWHADSWVGLESRYGQIRLGRMFTPSYEYAMLPADPFMHSWASSSITTMTGKATSPYRFDNGINYNVKSGGFRFGVTFAPSEGVTGTQNAYSTAASYTTGKLYMAAGHENQGTQHDVWNSLTARWGDDSLKVFSFYGFGRNKDNQSIRSYSVGASGKVAHGMLMASYSRMNNQDLDTTVQDKFSVGYHYMLSKRTRIYTNLAHDRAFKTNKTGFDVGIAHSF
ncbi:porin [Comamonas sp. Y33R10-2]|uniref:porin n=1 Tax=Comamonas sp. Y33R10-2 TaxID=2853257 RepID=UPI001C5CB2A5|nr:porin [Comamonas sp. Y33R10-2]QXZ09519.1 porin [Comamonas sp. Y33R10-2]